MTIVQRGLTLTGWRGRGLDMFIGAVAVLGHAPFHIWPVTLLCFAYLMVRLDDARRIHKNGFSRGMWFGLGYFLAGMFWIGSAFIARGPEFIPAMPPMILGLAALLAFFWGLAGRLYVRFAGTGALRWVSLVSLLWIAEYTRGHIFGGLPWNLPGYIFEAGGYASQLAAYAGIYGLSLVVFILSALLAKTVVQTFTWRVSLPLIALIGILFFADGLRPDTQVTAYHDNIKIRVVQVPFSQQDKFDREKSIAIVNNFIRTSMEPGIEDVTHLVWPEGAVVGLAIDNRPLLDAMGQILTQNDDTPPYWILNSLRTETRPPAPGLTPKTYYYNTSAVVAFDRAGNPALQAFNDKYRLVPFGEFIPGGEFMEKLGSKTLSTTLASITPARSKELANFPGLPRVSSQICYEIIFSGLSPRPKDGTRAEWILNQSNDAWYGKSVGPAQHANIAAYRAIEEGIPVVRSASNGISGLIASDGRYIQKLSAQESGVIDIRLPKPVASPHFKPWFNWALLLLNISLILISTANSRRGGSSI